MYERGLFLRCIVRLDPPALHYHRNQKMCQATVSPAMTMLTIDINLMRILRLGPDVSLNGSPTVSPTMVALWQSEPLPPKCPSSTIFLALSQAPPELAMKMASTKPVLSPPQSKPITPATPKSIPTTTGIRIANMEGTIISLCALLVDISTQRL